MIPASRSLFTCLLCVGASAQLLHPARRLPSYAVVSIRPSSLSEGEPHGSITQDTYLAERTTARDLIAYAFGLGDEQELVDAPSWVGKDRFDVQAKLDDDQLADLHQLDRDGREEQMRLMMQTVLSDRLHLHYHFGTRTLPVYELRTAKGGLKCPEDTTSPPAIADTARPSFRWYNAPAPPPSSAREAPRPASRPAQTLRTRGWPFWLLVSWIGHQPELGGRPVLDRTGLNSSYDCKMEWSPDVSDETGESIFSSLEGQLGLKLQPARDPVEVLVIDGIQRPSEN